jgi:thiol-disulfide isomerase/thioredoxin
MRPIAVALALLCVSPALAQTKPAPPAPKPAAAPAPDPAAAAEAKKLLEAARKAIADARALSYNATVEGAGTLAGKVPTVKADVSAARADAGGWKLYTKGTSTGADSGALPFEVSYDGVTAFSNKEKTKVIFEQEPDNLQQLAVFFSGQGAKHPVAWEVFADQPLDLNGGAAATEPAATIADVPCDVVLLHPKPLELGADADSKEGIRVWLAKSDHLPRKIERLLASPAGGSRVLTISDLKLNSESIGAAYTMQVPDGFQVKNPDPKPERTAGGGGKGGAGRQAPGNLGKGDAAPEWTLKDTEGKEHKLSDYKGKIVLLDFWATWCPPCRQAMPGVQRLHEKFKDQPVVVIGVNTSEGPGKDPAKYMKDQKFTYGLLLNGETLGDKYNISGIPAFFLIGPDGKLLWTEVGYNPASEKEVAGIIDKTLKSMEK